MKRYFGLAILATLVLIFAAAGQLSQSSFSFLFGSAEGNAGKMIRQGQQTFRFDTFGDQAFWGGQLKLHETINMLPPSQALALGLKIDSAALPPAVIQAIQNRVVPSI